MKILIQQEKEVSVVTLEGNIMQEDVAILRNRLDDQINKKQYKIVLNLNDVSYLSSLCLAVIVEKKNELLRLSGDLRIASGNVLVKNLFDLTHLSNNLRIFNSAHEAVASFG